MSTPKHPTTPATDLSELLEDYKTYLSIERNLSPLTVESYSTDVQHLESYAQGLNKSILHLTYPDLEQFLGYLADLGMGPRSMARTVSGIKSLYLFLEIEEIVSPNPTALLEGPAIGRHLPEVLSVAEIDAILGSIDTSTVRGLRDAAMIELLYSCGLRVSECCQLKYQSLFLDQGYVRIIGKGRKERLVPISPTAMQRLQDYISARSEMTPQAGAKDYLFLNRNGGMLSRQMLFMTVKKLATQAGIDKEISPHTFRHSFATHLLEGGANLIAIRDMLGHADVSTTEIYTHIDRSKLRREIIEHHPRNQGKR